jgi:hypothetical protein
MPRVTLRNQLGNHAPLHHSLYSVGDGTPAHRPTLKRAFRTHWSPWVPVRAGLSCPNLMLNLPLVTWLRFVAWR